MSPKIRMASTPKTKTANGAAAMQPRPSKKAAPRAKAPRAARRIMTDDGFNIGVLYAGNRTVYQNLPGKPKCTPADLEAEFLL